MKVLRSGSAGFAAAVAVVAAAGFLLHAAACGLRAMDHPVTVTECGTNAVVAEGEELTVRLKGAATAGYLWKAVSFNPQRLAYSGASEIQAGENTDVDGGLSRQLFRCRALAAGHDEILFHYVHLPKKDPRPLKTCLIRVTVVKSR